MTNEAVVNIANKVAVSDIHSIPPLMWVVLLLVGLGGGLALIEMFPQGPRR